MHFLQTSLEHVLQVSRVLLVQFLLWQCFFLLLFCMQLLLQLDCCELAFLSSTNLEKRKNKSQTKKKQNSLGLDEWWIQVKNKVKKLMIEHSTRLKHETLDIENYLKHQLEHSVIPSNFRLYSNLKKKLAKLQIEPFLKKLQKNEQLFQYSNNLATK